jgi:hypothetical protein
VNKDTTIKATPFNLNTRQIRKYQWPILKGEKNQEYSISPKDKTKQNDKTVL